MVTRLLKTFGGSHQEDEQLSKNVFNYLRVKKGFDQVGGGTLSLVGRPQFPR